MRDLLMKLFGKYKFEVTIYFKNSSAPVTFYTDQCTVTRKGSNIETLSWKRSYPKLLFTDVTQIAHINSRSL